MHFGAKPRQPRPADLSFAPGDTGTEMIVDQAGRGHGHSRRIDSCQRQAYMLSASDILKPDGSYFRCENAAIGVIRGAANNVPVNIKKAMWGSMPNCAREQGLTQTFYIDRDQEVAGEPDQACLRMPIESFLPHGIEKGPYRRAPLLAQPL